MPTCLCGHAAHLCARCPVLLCGCDIYRPRPSAADEASEWLAGREPGEIAARDGEVA